MKRQLLLGKNVMVNLSARSCRRGGLSRSWCRFLVFGIALAIGISAASEPGHARHSIFSTLFGARSHDLFDRSFNRHDSSSNEEGAAKPHSHGVRQQALPPDPPVELKDKSLENVDPLDALSAEIFRHLATSKSDAVYVRALHRGAIISFYGGARYQPLWVVESGLSLRAQRLMALFGGADEDGLRARDYLPSALSSFDGDFSNLRLSPRALARLDLELTAAALEYARHASAGRIDPIRISEMHTIKVDAAEPSQILRKLRSTVRPDLFLSSLHPDFPQYGRLKTALANYRKLESAEIDLTIPDGATLRPLAQDPAIVAVRKRLAALGIYEDPAKPEAAAIDEVPAAEETTFDLDLVAAVKAFQKQSGLRDDGIIGPNTRRALNGQSSAQRVRKIVLSMERLRWLPADLTDRYIFVNQAAFQSWLVDGGEVKFRSDVIVGKPKYQTAVFVDEMESVVLNPYWTVPRSLAIDQMLPKLRGDPGYLERQGFQLLNGRGQQVAWRSVDWRDITAKNLTYSFRQPPGPTNALGGLKFLFPNSHSIYMHDTPARHLFGNDVRAFSYGCVRLKQPYDLASVVLGPQGWTPKRIEAAVRNGQNQRVRLERKIPVYLGYYTAWVGADGGVKFHHDIYGRDRILSQALELTAEPLTRLGLATSDLN